MKNKQFDKYVFNENSLNMLGYSLLVKKRVDEAIEIIEFALREYKLQLTYMIP